MTDVRAANASMITLAVVLEALGALAPAAFGVGGDGGGLQGVRVERVWVGSDARILMEGPSTVLKFSWWLEQPTHLQLGKQKS